MATTRKMARATTPQLVNIGAFTELELKEIQNQVNSRLKEIDEKNEEERKERAAEAKVKRIQDAHAKLSVIRGKMNATFHEVEELIAKLPISDCVIFSAFPGEGSKISYHPVSGWVAETLQS